MRILGVDTGLADTGYGIIDAREGVCRIIEGGVITTAADEELPARLQRIHDATVAIIDEFDVDLVVVEDLYAEYPHPRTAIMMGHARGVVMLAAGERAVKVESYPASLVKKALTGNGRASKDQVRRMVMQTLKLAEAPGPDHVSDALALALCHAAPARRSPVARGRRRAGELPPAVAEAIARARGDEA
ncbi:MAG: crossover junction endodeoxyribonuclease RuvC [Armatimonadota bacterium]|nr:crossover junction endodeoxyribonuclease RuvC [Armatimonadota bacterium]